MTAPGRIAPASWSRGGPKTLDECTALARDAVARADRDPDGAIFAATLAHDRVCTIAADIRFDLAGTPEAARAIEAARAVGELWHETKMTAAASRRKGSKPCAR